MAWRQDNLSKIVNPYDVLCFSYSQLQNYKEAESWYGHRLGKDKDNYQLILGLANVLYNQGKYEEAEKLYLRVS